MLRDDPLRGNPETSILDSKEKERAIRWGTPDALECRQGQNHEGR
jgi:hypothetical protein